MTSNEVITTSTNTYSEPISESSMNSFGFAKITPNSKWWVLHTKSRQEKVVADAVRATDANCFLPLVSKVRFYGKRKAKADLPLFPSYVFLFGTIEQAYAIDRTDRIAGIIKVPNQAQIHWELSNLRLAIVHEVPLDPYPYLKEGLRAEVRSGPLKGLQGKIESRLNPGRLILQVDMLGRAVSVEVDAALLEVVE